MQQQQLMFLQQLVLPLLQSGHAACALACRTSLSGLQVLAAHVGPAALVYRVVSSLEREGLPSCLAHWGKVYPL